MNLAKFNRARVVRAVLQLWVVMCVVMAAPRAWADAAATVTTLAISADTVPYKSPIVLTATVASGNNPVTAGLVLFCDATAPVCENNSALGLAQLSSPDAKATLKLGSGPLGVHKYKAVFRANSSYLSSTSNVVSYTVQGTYASATTVSSSGSVGAYTLSGTVAGVGSVFNGPTGNVSFIDTSAGNTTLGSSALGTAVLSNTFVAAPSSPFAIATSTTPRRSVAIASAYLDSDDNLDVVTGDYSQTITVLLGNGDGSFQPEVTYPGCPSGYAVKIALADFNRDGKTDVALGCTDGTSGSLTIILGNGNGTFQSPQSYTAGDVAGIAIGDFNNDGMFDIAVSNHTQSNVMLFTGNGNGTFNTGVQVLSPSAELHDVVVGDFNGDGKDDLLFAVNSATSSRLSDLYLATGTGSTTIGTGSFNTAALIATKVGEFLAAGDVNGDNLPDIISCTITGTPPNVGNSLWVVLNQGTTGGITTFASPVVYQSDIPSDPHLADVNGDGKPDIIAGGSYGTLVYLGDGTGSFKPYTEPTIGNFALTYAVNAGDYNNDGNADLIGTDASSPRAAVALSQVAQKATAAALAGVAVYPLGSGTHQVDASYAGDSIYQASVSSTTVPLLAAPTSTTTVLTVSPTSATVSGQTVTLTATVTPYTVGPPTTTSNGDTVNFFNGTTQLGSSTVTNGVATFSTTALPVGSDALSAQFMGDASNPQNYLASTSSTMTVTVTTIVLTSSANPSSYGQPVTITATVPSGFTGTVTFNDGSTVLGTSTIAGSVATYTTSTFSVGQHNITGAYSGNHNAATSPVLVQTVNPATPVVNVTTSGPSIVGSPVTITVTLPAGGSGIAGATGTVTVTSGTTTIGSGPLSGGVYTVQTSTLPVGTDLITASYVGDGNYTSATGSTNQTVNKATPTLPAPVVNPSSPVTGSPVTITEQVPSGVGGPVLFMDGSTVLGSAPIDGSGTATLTAPSLPAGSNTITASTPGDTNNNPATSPGTTVTVSKITATLSVTATGAGTYGAAETITATVQAGATGTITFASGGTTLGQGAVNASGVVTITTTSLPAGTDTITANYGGDSSYSSATGSTSVTIAKVTPTVTVAATGAGTYGATETITATLPAGVTGTVTFVSGSTTLGSGTVDASGVATITTTSLPVGSDTVTANYGGDTNNNSASGSTSVTIAKATPTVTVAVSGANTYGATETITATMPTTATGTVTFVSGSTTLGSGTVNGSGVATITTTSLPVGSDTVTANYGGDSNYNLASGSTSVTIGKATPTVTVAAAGAGTYGATETITATVPTGVTGTISFVNGGNTLGSGTVNAGTVTITTTSLPVGSDTFTANYGGDGNYNSASGSTTVAIGKVTPTLPAPVVNPTTLLTSSQVTITEAVPSGTPGPVTFMDGTTVLGTATIDGSGTATLTLPSLALGPHSITASTPADTNHNPATSPATSVTVYKATPTVTVVVTGAGTYGSTETITATLPAGTPGAVTGTVTFVSGGTTLGQGTVNASGVATITTTSLPAGNDSITANYGGDSNYSPASGSTSVLIAQTTPTETVTTTTTGGMYGGTTTITVTLPPGTTGTVTVTNGGTVVGTGTVNPTTGTVTITTTPLPAGTDTLTVTYGGDSNNTPVTTTTTVTITKATPPVSVSSSSNPSTATQAVTFTATLPTNTTGTVTFSDGSVVIGTAPITNGVATVTTSTLSSGGHTITASYSGDSNNNPNSSQPLSQSVNKNSPVLPPPSVSSTNTDAISPVTISEQVPTGVSGPVTFYDNGTVIGTGTVVNGVATLSMPTLPVGSEQITASTPGDANNNPATSPATVVTVNKVQPVLPAPGVSSTSPVIGASVTITEQVPTGVTGTVTFYNGGTVIGTAPVNNGTATISTSTLPLGNNPITASTQANASYNAATSPATNVDVAKNAGSVTLTSSANPAALNRPVTLTATVNQGATGVVTFLDGGAVLGVGTINSAGVATFTTSTLGGGTHSITASFAGDSNYNAATSAPLSQVVSKTPTTIVVTMSQPIELVNSSVTFTANVTAPNPTPTGTVTFFDNGTAIGTTQMSTNGGAIVSLALSGSATYTTSLLTTGTHTITATYSGDSAFMPSSSLPAVNIVADFTNNTKGETMQKMFPGGSTMYTFVLTPVGSDKFLSDTTVTVSGLPEGTTYSFSPAVISAGSSATTVTLTVTTSKSLKAANHTPAAPGSSNDVPISLAAIGLAGLGAIRRYRKQMPRLMLAVLLVLASLLPLAAMSGCAGGYFALNPTNYTIQVTGTEGPIQHTATTTLVVQ
jgi:hypothetical protein